MYLGIHRHPQAESVLEQVKRLVSIEGIKIRSCVIHGLVLGASKVFGMRKPSVRDKIRAHIPLASTMERTTFHFNPISYQPNQLAGLYQNRLENNGRERTVENHVWFMHWCLGSG